MTTPLTEIETVPCSRCGGSGQYSYCSMYGSTCFKCGGAKRVFTKRGLAAHNYLVALRSSPAEHVVPGMLVKMSFGMTGEVHAFAKCTKSEPNTLNSADGWLIEAEHPKLGGVGYHCNRLTMIRVGQTAERKQATLLQAIKYQSELKKDGTRYTRKPKLQEAA